MTKQEMRARLAAIEAERVLVATNDGTHGKPADLYTWKRYADAMGRVWVDNQRALDRGEGTVRQFSAARNRIAELARERAAILKGLSA